MDGIGEGEDRERRDDGGVEAARGESNAGGGVDVEYELRGVASSGKLLPAASSKEGAADVDVEAKHYDDDDEENDDGE